jgi:glutaredoxin
MCSHSRSLGLISQNDTREFYLDDSDDPPPRSGFTGVLGSSFFRDGSTSIGFGGLIMSEHGEQYGMSFWLGLTTSMIVASVAAFGIVTAIDRYMGRSADSVEVREVDMSLSISEISSSPSIVIASKTCPVCARAREWSSKNGIALDFVEMSDSPEAKKIMSDLGFRGVPVLLTKGAAVQGFDPAIWGKLLERS